MAKVKLVAILVLIAIAVILLYQNRMHVETRLLFARVPMSLSILLLITTLVGFGLGMLTALLVMARKRTAPKKD